MKVAFLFCLIFTACKPQTSKSLEVAENTSAKLTKQNPTYKVIGVKDGDTFALLIDGKEESVRLEHIDCPEKNQPLGKKAKQLASDLVFGKEVWLKWDGKRDRNKRIIAEVWLDSLNINQEMVRQGVAWHFKKYSKDSTYAVLELEARKNKVGIWADSTATAPWLWRKSRRKK